MELSEAKSILEQEKRLCLLYGRNQFIGNIEAIDTVLKALQEYEKQMDLEYVRENYIPKDKVKSLLQVMESEKEIYMKNEDGAIVTELDYIIKKIEELLGE